LGGAEIGEASRQVCRDGGRALRAVGGASHGSAPPYVCCLACSFDVD
jgi:hypothetical protein